MKLSVQHLILVVLVFCVGCQQQPPRSEQLVRGLIWMFPGIEGGYWSMGEARRAFRDKGVDSAIITYDWDHPFWPFANLMDYKTNLQAAQRVAGDIVQYRDLYPDQPIDLVGYSGGGGMALMVAEALPVDIHLRNIVLVHPAVSGDYDLTSTLERVDGEIVNFYSDLDWFILGVGTSVFGTMDRKKVASAGKEGFDLTKAVPDVQQRRKVRQCPWSIKQLSKGRWGGHFGIHLYDFNKRYVAPLCVSPNEDIKTQCEGE